MLVLVFVGAKVSVVLGEIQETNNEGLLLKLYNGGPAKALIENVVTPEHPTASKIETVKFVPGGKLELTVPVGEATVGDHE